MPANAVEILSAVLPGYALPRDGDHGLRHWARVADNGDMLAAATPGADAAVVRLFALLHDCRRLNEDDDPEHGRRGALMAEELFARAMLDINGGQLGVLMFACEAHDRGDVTTDPTVGCCWDADRLDLLRVGTRPDVAYFSTSHACLPATLRLCNWAAAENITRFKTAQEWNLKHFIEGGN